MAMSKKNYVEMAEVLKAHRPVAKTYARGTFDNLVKDLIDYFGQDNPRFDAGRFAEAVYGNEVRSAKYRHFRSHDDKVTTKDSKGRVKPAARQVMVLDEVDWKPFEHSFDADADRCVCGGEWQWYDGPEVYGYACERGTPCECGGTATNQHNRRWHKDDER